VGKKWVNAERWGNVGLQLQYFRSGAASQVSRKDLKKETGLRGEERAQRNMRMRLEDYIKNVQHKACVDLQWENFTVLSLLLLLLYRLHSCLKGVEDAPTKLMHHCRCGKQVSPFTSTVA
jgi:hypothetical protein